VPLAAVPDLDRELDLLYGSPLDEFTAARNDLAARLRKAGQEDAAERVRALKKPSVPVWTVNQLARRHEGEVRSLVDAGERLRRAQQEAFGGEGAEALREATAAERETVRRLTHAAQTLLKAEGRSASQAVLERVASTLRTAAVDPDAAHLLAAGRLAGELDAPGFDAVAELAPAKPVATQARAREAQAAQRREAELRKLQARVDRLERKLADDEERAQRTKAELDDARRELDDFSA
jgi:peptidoglycan hydrolase CwlO-like protein